MGCAQLEQVDAFVARKREIHARYVEAFANLPGLSPMQEAPWARAAFWMFTVLVDPGQFGMGSRELLRHLHEQKIQTRPLWEPMHRSRAHAGSFSPGCPVADELHDRALSLPCSVGLTAGDQERVIEAVRAAAR
jgi:perosamine synthetase